MIYFDRNKEAHAYEIDNYIAETTMSIWMQYCDGIVGADWDIIDNMFTPLVDPKTIQENKMLPIRASERNRLYMDADEQIAKCNDYIELDMDAERYKDYKKNLIIYKMDVRDTIHQERYPLEVDYPELPRE